MTYRHTRKWIATAGLAGLAATIGLIAASSASGQDADAQRWGGGSRPDATIYRDMGFNGPAVAVQEANPNLGLAWPVNSIRVRGGRWELCSQAAYRGDCRTVDADNARLGTLLRGITVQSIRPVGGGGGGGGGGNPGTPGPSLRGNFAEFYTTPQRWGQRVAACQRGSATASCAARTADEFCRSVGWNGSAREHMETVNRTVYLADVLCVRSGY